MGAEDLHHRYDDPPRGKVAGEPLMLINSKNYTLMTLALVYRAFVKAEAQSALNKSMSK